MQKKEFNLRTKHPWPLGVNGQGFFFLGPGLILERYSSRARRLPPGKGPRGRPIPIRDM